MENDKDYKFSEIIRLVLLEEMEKNPRLFILGEDIGAWGGRDGITKGFLEKFGKARIIETPINEELFVGIALGAAQAGLRPIVELVHGSPISIAASDIFLAGIWTKICKNTSMPSIIIRLRWGGGFMGGEISVPLISMFNNFMGVSIVSPSTHIQALGILRTALESENKVIIFLEHIALYNKRAVVSSNNAYQYPIGRGEYRRRGRDLTIITHSNMVYEAEQAANELEHEGIDIEILDLVSLKPIDSAIIEESARKNRKFIIVDEEPAAGGGIYPIVENILRKVRNDVVVKVVGAEQSPPPPGLNKFLIPQKENILSEVRNILKNQQQ